MADEQINVIVTADVEDFKQGMSEAGKATEALDARAMAATKRLEKIRAGATRQALTQEQKIRAQIQKRLQLVEKLGQQGAKASEVQSAKLAVLIAGEARLAKARARANRQMGVAQAASQAVAKSLEGLKKSADSVGGKTGELAGRLQNAAEAFALLGGPASIVVASTVAFAAFTAAGLAAAASMSDVIKSLREMGRTEGITPGQIKTAKQVDEAMTNLQVTLSEATLALGQDFAPALIYTTEVIDGVVQALLALDRNTEPLQKIGEYASLAAAPVTMLADAFAQVSRAAKEMDDQINANNKALQDMVDNMPTLHLPFVTAEDVAKKHEEENKKRNDKAVKRANDRARAEKQLQAIAQAAQMSQLDGEALLIEQLEQRITKINELAGADKMLAEEAAAARLAVEEQYTAELGKLRDEQHRQWQEQAREQRALHEENVAARIEANRAELEQARQYQGARVSLEQTSTDLIMALEDELAMQRRMQARKSLEIASMVTDGLLQLYDTRTKGGKKAARATFAVDKALRAGQAAMNGATAVTAALATPPPFNIPLAALIGAQAAAQVAIIAKQRPQFHTGTANAADEFVMRQNERLAVLTKQATDSGIEQQIDRANGGLSPMGGTVSLTIGHRAFDAQMTEAGRRSGSGLQRALQANRPAPGHSRRR